MGEALVNGITDEGEHIDIKSQAAPVTKALGAVRKMVRAGNKVVFDEDEHGNNKSYILDKRSGAKTEMKDKKGTYKFNIWVKRPVERGVNAVSGSNQINIQEKNK